MNPPSGADSLAIPAPSQSESISKLVYRAQSELRAEESGGDLGDLLAELAEQAEHQAINTSPTANESVRRFQQGLVGLWDLRRNKA